MIGLGFNLRCRGDVGAGIGTDGRLLLFPGDWSESLPELSSSFGAAASVSTSFSLFASLFFPPIPADTSARTLRGSPSFLALFESEPSSMRASSSLSEPPSFFRVVEFSAVVLLRLLDRDVSSESAEADTATCTPRADDTCAVAVEGAGAGGLKSLR